MSEPYWVPLGAAPVVEHGTELAYAERATLVTVTATEAVGDLVVAAPAVTFDGSPILVEFWCPMAITAAPVNSFVTAALWEDGVGTGRGPISLTPGGAIYTAMYGAWRRSPSAGSHTYSIRAASSGGAASIGAEAYTSPAFIRITKV